MKKVSVKIVQLSFEQDYLPGKPVLPLVAACELSPFGDILRACISDQLDTVQLLAEQSENLDTIAQQLGIAVLDFSAPWQLQPVHIPKPWGQEIWYTGIEARGVSQVMSETGVTPLSWAIALDHQRVLGPHQKPNLLKILDPLPDEVYGDLYFELHEKKREVYIVTHVDETAWPNGVGAIRFGFSADKRLLFANDDDFLAAYCAAVKDYRAVRCEIDAQLDVLRQQQCINLNEAISAAQLKQWLLDIPHTLIARETTLRSCMDSFTASRELRVGDVLAVPLLTPHALQHGVRTIEFQTPVYERKILSFAQKVLTQDHWDTDEALQLAQMHAPMDAVFPVLLNANGVKIEQIVAFEDFFVQRVYLAPGAEYCCRVDKSYLLLIAVLGQVQCGATCLQPEQAVLLPLSATDVLLQNSSSDVAVLLVAKPV